MKNFLILSLLLAFLTTEVCAQWKPAGDKIKTQWANKINTSAVLPEYPRPIMERNEWKNLNGLWEYAITDLGGNVPAHFDGQILVPFAVESSLSGVGQRVGAKKELWYSRSFEVPVAWKNKNVLLHFGAVDWKADIWVNDVRHYNISAKCMHEGKCLKCKQGHECECFEEKKEHECDHKHECER